MERADAGGGAGHDDIARFEGHDLGDESDEEGRREDHLLGVCPLPELAVDRTADFEFADLFFADLAKGSMLRDHDPVFLLREKLMFYKSRLGARLTRQEACALVVKAWNYRRTGRLVKKLIWAKKNGEAFPTAC